MVGEMGREIGGHRSRLGLLGGGVGKGKEGGMTMARDIWLCRIATRARFFSFVLICAGMRGGMLRQ